MAISKCPKCGNTTFGIESIIPENKQQEVKVLFCENCHTIIGPICFREAVDNIDSIRSKIEEEDRGSHGIC